MSVGRPQQLKIVFALEVRSGSDVRLGDEDFRPLFKAGGVDGRRVLQTIASTMQELGIAPGFRRPNGMIVSVKGIERQIELERKWPPGLEADGLAFQVGDVTAMRQSFVLVQEKKAGAADLWDAWILPFLGDPNFVQGWVSDIEYDYWQNATDPAEFTAAGHGFEHLPLKSNGLPPPLEKKVIDTSRNPGRWTFRPGYIEAIGSPMWLGPRFWALVGRDGVEALQRVPWLETSKPYDGILKLSAGLSFEDETSQVFQNELRARLYG